MTTDFVTNFVSYEEYMDSRSAIVYRQYCIRRIEKDLEETIMIKDCSELLADLLAHEESIKYLRTFRIA